MRVVIRVLLAVGSLVAMLSPGQAQALLHSECGGSYSRNTSCMFTAVGPNLYISGSTTASGLTVRISDPTGNVMIASCVGTTSCYAQVGPGSTGTDSVGPPAGVGPLLCTVITTGSGSFRCQSNT